ncbi:hypothetical protein [Deinococcus maricopensis]|nr:hypothetical protein [Deinococcus maricopensis]
MQHFGPEDIARVRWLKDQRSATVILRPGAQAANVGDEILLDGREMRVEKLLWPRNGLWGGIVLLRVKRSLPDT